MTETAPDRVAELTDADFDAALASPLPLLVDFGDRVCGPCPAMERPLEALAGEYAGRARVAQVEAPANPGVTARYGVLGLPTFVLFRDGREVARLPGTPPRAALRRWLDDALAQPAPPAPGTAAGTTPEPYDAETLETLACDLNARPAAAPHFGAVADAVRAVRRAAGALVVDYAPEAGEILEAIVAAERACCAELGWHLERADPGAGAAPVVRLRVEAAPAQLDALAPIFAAPAGA
jgi:thioredoxin-like negative regulator of GroEL